MTGPPDRPLGAALSRLRPLLESPRVVGFAGLVAALLVVPSLFAGLATEDFAQRDFVTHAPLLFHVNLFGHAAGWKREEVPLKIWEAQLHGWFPWTGDPNFDASFFRPLASLTHHFDYRLFPSHPALMHAESILWYAALVLAVGALHVRLLEPRWAAGLAALLYAVDDAHGQPVGWLINRNALLASTFSVVALLAYDAFRRRGRRVGAVLTPIFLALALGSAEFSLCIGGYFVAYVLTVDEGPPRARRAATLLWVLPFVVWAFFYVRNGYGTHGSGLYLDPRVDPIGYAFGLTERSAMLLMGQFGAPFSDLWAQSTPGRQGFLVFHAAAFTWFVGWALVPVLARSARARFFALGMLLSLPPAAATFPEDRLLLLAGVGAFPLVALAIDDATAPGSGRARRALAWGFVALHACAAPILLPYRTLRMFRFERELRVASESAEAALSHVPGEALIFVNARDFYFGAMVPATRKARGEPELPRVMTLAGTLERTVVHRSSLTRLEVRPKDGFLSQPFNRIHRNPALGFRRGQTLDLRGVDVIITEVDQWGAPLAAEFEFALPLGSPRYHFLAFSGGRFVPFRLPAIGESVVVGGA